MTTKQLQTLGQAVGIPIALLLGLSVAVSACVSNTETRDGDAVVLRQTVPSDQLAVEDAIRGLDRMRSGLASTINPEQVDASTFAQVCKPVGARAKEVASESGWVVRQVASKYRNPSNQIDAQAAGVIDRFVSNPELDSLWVRAEHNDAEGWRYLRRISIEPTCLACHGAKNERPEFVVTGYPEDKAFDFAAGDLRGLYSVFVPDAAGATGTPGAPPITDPADRPVTRIEAADYLANRSADAVLLDVRTSTEYQESHVDGATNVDVMAADFRERVAKLEKGRTYYLYCRSGNRSNQAGEAMREMGFESLYNVGGLDDLQRAGASVITN